METDREFSRYSGVHGPGKAFEHFMAEGAILYRHNSPPLAGREAIREAFRNFPAGILRWEPQFADIAASGDLGYTLGNYEFVEPQPEGGEKISRGQYVTIWKKQSDGTWKFVFDTGTSLPGRRADRSKQIFDI